MEASQHDPLDDALATVLDRPRAEWETALAAACAREPARAEALRTRFRELLLVADDWTPDLAAIPERVGRYRLRERVGGGGMGVVYRATDVDAGTEVALKLVRPEHLMFAGARERFRREVEACVALRHDGIVKVHEFGESDGIPYFAMELVQGLDLGHVTDRLAGRSPASLHGRDLAALLDAARADGGGAAGGALAAMTWAEAAADIVRQAALAVEHAHAAGLLHRDLKPANLMLEANGRVRVLDFGLSLREGMSRLTRSGAVVGSLPYTAPEVLASGAGDRRADVYGLGVTLYELLALRSPFLQSDPEQTRRRILDGSYQPIARLWPGVPRGLETVCIKAMAREPKQRYATARELAADLQRAMAKVPVAARRPGPVALARQFVRRHPTGSAVLLLFALLLSGAPLLLMLQARSYVADLERLADELVVDDLVAEDATLWPAAPERAAAMADWIARAFAVLTRRPVHEATQARLRLQALPRTDAETAADSDRWQQTTAARETATAALAAQQQAGFDRSSSHAFAVAADRLAELIDVEPRATWRFADTSQQWQHGRLSALLGKLRLLPARVAGMQQRLAFAREVDARSLEQPRAAWAAAIAAIGNSPLYHGLQLRPQRGLVPLGPDPTSGLYEFAHLASGSVPPRDPATGRLRLDADCGVVLVLLPAGTFRMGAGADDAMALPPELPQHLMQLDAFFIAKHEMTQAQWYRATGDNPAEITPANSPSGESITLLHPVENVSWYQCEQTLLRLDLQLPTEAQWEYAARGGTTTPWWTGPDAASLAGGANVRDQQFAAAGFQDCAPFDDGFVLHAPIGSFRANGFGLHDVLGNVDEWVHDNYADYTVAPRAGDDRRGVAAAPTNAVYRGGAYMESLKVCRVSWRKKEERGNRWSYTGVRPQRRIEP